ncbi:MAG: hypothetical protein LBH12_07190, partial [Dysgonamonadaceae bacterium]|nr:hypothetical protein [Dysgonamonadaceae bacterium]
MKNSQTKCMETPLELQKELVSSRRSMSIGIPKENQKEEKRLIFTPEAVDMLVDSGHEVIVEEGAGWGINYSDKDYAESGAFLSNDK